MDDAFSGNTPRAESFGCDLVCRKLLFPNPARCASGADDPFQPGRAWWYALVCTSASVLGALAGYLIGAVLFDAVAMPLLTFYGFAHKFATFAEVYNDWGAWIVPIAGVTPFPFKVVAVASGATGLYLFAFVIFSIIARRARFYAVASLLYYFGPPVREFIEQRLDCSYSWASGTDWRLCAVESSALSAPAFSLPIMLDQELCSELFVPIC